MWCIKCKTLPAGYCSQCLKRIIDEVRAKQSCGVDPNIVEDNGLNPSARKGSRCKSMAAPPITS